MKSSVVNTLAGILAGMKLNRIMDKDVKSALLADYLVLRKQFKSWQADQQELINKFQEDWRDDMVAVRALRKENKPVEGYDEYLSAEADANAALQELMDSEVEVEIRPVKLDKFLASISEEDLNFEQVAFMAENGLIEE